MIKKFFIFFSSAFLIPVFTFAFEYHVSTPIPGITGNASYDLGSFVANFFQLGLALVGITSFGFIIYNGIQYVVFSNNESKINEAREGIKQAIFGFLLLISSVVILDTINPCILQTVNFWKSRETINATCNKPNSSTIPSVSSPNTSPSVSLKDQLINKLITSGTEIQTYDPLVITGVIPDPENPSKKTVRRIKIQGSSSDQVGQYIVYGFTDNNPESVNLLKKISDGIYTKGSSSIFSDFIDYSSKSSSILSSVKDFLISSSKNKFTSAGYYSSYTVKGDKNNPPDPLKFSFEEEINRKTVTSSTPSSCAEVESGLLSCGLKIKVFVPAAGVSFDSGIAQFYISSVSSDAKIIEGAFEYLIKNDPAIKNAFNN